MTVSLCELQERALSPSDGTQEVGTLCEQSHECDNSVALKVFTTTVTMILLLVNLIRQLCVVRLSHCVSRTFSPTAHTETDLQRAADRDLSRSVLSSLPRDVHALSVSPKCLSRCAQLFAQPLVAAVPTRPSQHVHVLWVDALHEIHCVAVVCGANMFSRLNSCSFPALARPGEDRWKQKDTCRHTFVKIYSYRNISDYIFF